MLLPFSPQAGLPAAAVGALARERQSIPIQPRKPMPKPSQRRFWPMLRIIAVHILVKIYSEYQLTCVYMIDPQRIRVPTRNPI